MKSIFSVWSFSGRRGFRFWLASVGFFLLSLGVFLVVLNFNQTRNLLPRAASQGQSFAFSASGFAPGERVSTWVSLANGQTQALPIVSANRSGQVAFAAVSKDNWPSGGVRVVARGNSSKHEEFKDYQYSGAPASGGGQGGGSTSSCPDGEAGPTYVERWKAGGADGGRCETTYCTNSCCRDSCQCTGTCGGPPQIYAPAVPVATGLGPQNGPDCPEKNPDAPACRGMVAWGECKKRNTPENPNACDDERAYVEASHAYNEAEANQKKNCNDEPDREGCLNKVKEQHEIDHAEDAVKREAGAIKRVLSQREVEDATRRTVGACKQFDPNSNEYYSCARSQIAPPPPQAQSKKPKPKKDPAPAAIICPLETRVANCPVMDQICNLVKREFECPNVSPLKICVEPIAGTAKCGPVKGPPVAMTAKCQFGHLGDASVCEREAQRRVAAAATPGAVVPSVDNPAITCVTGVNDVKCEAPSRRQCRTGRWECAKVIVCSGLRPNCKAGYSMVCDYDVGSYKCLPTGGSTTPGAAGGSPGSCMQECIDIGGSVDTCVSNCRVETNKLTAPPPPLSTTGPNSTACRICKDGGLADCSRQCGTAPVVANPNTKLPAAGPGTTSCKVCQEQGRADCTAFCGPGPATAPVGKKQCWMIPEGSPKCESSYFPATYDCRFPSPGACDRIARDQFNEGKQKEGESGGVGKPPVPAVVPFWCVDIPWIGNPCGGQPPTGATPAKPGMRECWHLPVSGGDCFRSDVPEKTGTCSFSSRDSCREVANSRGRSPIPVPVQPTVPVSGQGTQSQPQFKTCWDLNASQKSCYSYRELVNEECSFNLDECLAEARKHRWDCSVPIVGLFCEPIIDTKLKKEEEVERKAEDRAPFCIDTPWGNTCGSTAPQPAPVQPPQPATPVCNPNSVEKRDCEESGGLASCVNGNWKCDLTGTTQAPAGTQGGQSAKKKCYGLRENRLSCYPYYVDPGNLCEFVSADDCKSVADQYRSRGIWCSLPSWFPGSCPPVIEPDPVPPTQAAPVQPPQPVTSVCNPDDQVKVECDKDGGTMTCTNGSWGECRYPGGTGAGGAVVPQAQTLKECWDLNANKLSCYSYQESVDRECSFNKGECLAVAQANRGFQCGIPLLGGLVCGPIEDESKKKEAEVVRRAPEGRDPWCVDTPWGNTCGSTAPQPAPVQPPQTGKKECWHLPAGSGKCERDDVLDEDLCPFRSEGACLAVANPPGRSPIPAPVQSTTPVGGQAGSAANIPAGMKICWDLDASQLSCYPYRASVDKECSFNEQECKSLALANRDNSRQICKVIPILGIKFDCKPAPPPINPQGPPLAPVPPTQTGTTPVGGQAGSGQGTVPGGQGGVGVGAGTQGGQKKCYGLRENRLSCYPYYVDPGNLCEFVSADDCKSVADQYRSRGIWCSLPSWFPGSCPPVIEPDPVPPTQAAPVQPQQPAGSSPDYRFKNCYRLSSDGKSCQAYQEVANVACDDLVACQKKVKPSGFSLPCFEIFGVRSPTCPPVTPAPNPPGQTSTFPTGPGSPACALCRDNQGAANCGAFCGATSAPVSSFDCTRLIVNVFGETGELEKACKRQACEHLKGVWNAGAQNCIAENFMVNDRHILETDLACIESCVRDTGNNVACQNACLDYFGVKNSPSMEIECFSKVSGTGDCRLTKIKGERICYPGRGQWVTMEMCQKEKVSGPASEDKPVWCSFPIVGNLFCGSATNQGAGHKVNPLDWKWAERDFEFLVASNRGKSCSVGSVDYLSGVAVFCVPSETDPAKGAFTGRCLPGMVSFDKSTGQMLKCNNSYDWQYGPAGIADDLEKELRQEFLEAEKFREELQNKYGVTLVNAQQYWTKKKLVQLEEVLAEFASAGKLEFFQGRLVMMIPYETFQKSYTPYSGSNNFRGNVDDVVLIPDSSFPTDQLQADMLKAALVHEFAHRWDNKHRELGLFKQSDFLDFIQAASKDHVSFDLITTALTAESVDHLKLISSDLAPSSSYLCSLNTRFEFYACVVQLYYDQGAAMKEKTPALYNYVKEKVFGGKEFLH